MRDLQGTPLPSTDELLARAAASQQAQQQLIAILNQALNQPSASHRYPVNLTGIADDPSGAKVLLVGLPTGERLEIPISADACRQLARHLLTAGAPTNGSGAEGEAA